MFIILLARNKCRQNCIALVETFSILLDQRPHVKCFLPFVFSLRTLFQHVRQFNVFGVQLFVDILG